ncbi:hypothetical protein LP7551_05122 [Roseibium album]|nr:hypothetical protein LP7551_05122 [Roseibium album]
MTTRRDFIKSVPAAGAFVVAGGSLSEGVNAANAQTAVPCSIASSNRSQRWPRYNL